jgi:hypothetical protein
MKPEDRPAFKKNAAKMKDVMIDFAREIGGEYSTGPRFDTDDLPLWKDWMPPAYKWFAKHVGPFIEDMGNNAEPTVADLEFYTKGDYNTAVFVDCAHREWLIRCRLDWASKPEAVHLSIRCPIESTRKFEFSLHNKMPLFFEKPLIDERKKLSGFQKWFIPEGLAKVFESSPRMYRIFLPAFRGKFVATCSEIELGNGLVNDRFVRECLLRVDRVSLRAGALDFFPHSREEELLTLLSEQNDLTVETLKQHLDLAIAFLDAMDKMGVIDSKAKSSG